MAGTHAIRRARPSDAASLQDCLARAFAEYRGSYTALGFADTVLAPETVVDRMQKMVVYVAAQADGSVAGTVSWSKLADGVGQVRGMAVLPELRGGELAGRLLDTVEEDMRAQGCSRAVLGTTEVLHRALAFYQRRGYRRTGRVHDFFGMPLHELEKELGRRAPLPARC